jgi:tetratricopeptide (TPR) repeat protein
VATPHDSAFAGAAVRRQRLTSEQVMLGAKVQNVLAELGISKTLAVIAVEAKWIEHDEAIALVTALRKQGVDHPEVKPREASDADDAVLDRLPPQARKRLEAASRSLAALFYARSAGTLALDQTASGGRPAPPPVRRVKPAVEFVAPPPKKSGALGAILAVVAAFAAIIGLIVVKNRKQPEPEPEPPPIASKPPPKPKPPPPPPPPPPPAPKDETDETDIREPSSDPTIEERRKKYIAEQEREAEKLHDEIKKLVAEGRPAAARGKLKQLSLNYGWTEYVKGRSDELARLTKELETEAAAPSTDEPMDPGDPASEGPALPAMAAALKRMDDGAALDQRRTTLAKTRLAGTKFELALVGGRTVKGAEIVDVSREDLRVRGEIDGAKVDLLLSWSALEPASFLAVQRQVSRGSGAAGQFELGRAALQRRLWKEARAAFEECARNDAAWKPRLPDVAAVLSDPAVLRGAARRLSDVRLLVAYDFEDPDQAADFISGPSAPTIANRTLKFAGKDGALWTLKDLTFDDHVDLRFEVEGDGAVGFAAPGQNAGWVIHFGSGSMRIEGVPNPVSFAAGSPLRMERHGARVRVSQGDRVLCEARDAAGAGPRRLVFGGKGDAGFRKLVIAGDAAGEMEKRLGPLERLEGGAHAGDFRLEPPPFDPEARSRAALAEAALESGQLDEAWNLAEEAVTKKPTGGLAYAVRGRVRLAQGELRLAMADADLALSLDPWRGEVALRARRILGVVRGAGAFGAFRRKASGPWDLRTDGAEDRLNSFAGMLEEAARTFAEVLKDAGSQPKAIRVAIFTSPEAAFAYRELAENREAVVVDEPGVDLELTRRVAKPYLKAAVPRAPAWFEEGMSAHLAGEVRAAEMKDLLAQASPVDALVRKSSADFTETDRLQAQSFVRFLLSAHQDVIPDLLKKLRHDVPAIEAFSGKDLKKLDAEWRAWAAK